MADARKVLDLSYLASAADGDTEFIRVILAEYLVEMANFVRELGDPARLADTPFVLRAAHTMKGASANVGANRVRDVASHLETLALRGGGPEGSRALIALLGQEVGRVRELVERQTVEQLVQMI